MEEDMNVQQEEKVTKKDIKKGIGIGIGAFFGVILLTFLILLMCGFQFYFVVCCIIPNFVVIWLRIS